MDDEFLSIKDVDDRINRLEKDDMLNSAFKKGIDLREYDIQIECELDALMKNTQLAYVKHTDTLVEIARDIKSCDSILEDMGHTLTGFQNDLFTLSSNIETIQTKSHLLDTRLKNRTKLQLALHESLEGLVISPDLIKKITDGEINEFFIDHLQQIDTKMSYVVAQSGKKIYALKEIGPELERLRIKATEKIREFFLKKIESLRTPNTNIAIIQQNVLLKYKELFWFLIERYSEAATEIKVNYVNTVSNYYSASFDKYVKVITKLQSIIADKLDLMGCEENAKRGLFKPANLKEKPNVFTLGERAVILEELDTGIILGHSAMDQSLKFPSEAIFKSIHRLLVDNGSSEYCFSSLFFSSPSMRQKPDLTIADVVFSEIFDTTIKMLQANTRQLVESNFDAVGILLCIRVNAHNLMTMQKRRIPCFDSYLNGLNLMLWPRFQAIIDLHIDSLRKASLPKILVSKDTHPHYITRRYAEFSASILTLNNGYNDALLTNSLMRLRNEVEALLIRMSGEMSDRKVRVIFLINNYDLVSSILSEHTTQSFDAEKAHFATVLDQKTQEYVEEELNPLFASLISFVGLMEPEQNLAAVDTSKFEKVAGDFNTSWKPAINTINSSVIQSFPNFQNGSRILHVVLTHLLLYYKRFLVLWEKRFTGASKKVGGVFPIGVQAVMVEIKKFKSVY